MTIGRRINAQISVSPQITVNDLVAIKAAGFQIVMANRPDGEEAGQPNMADIADAARALGLQFIHLPVAGGQFPPEAIAGFKAALDGGKKLFAFCRSGTRCATLWSLASAGERPADEILAQTSAAGYDLSGLADYLRAAETDG